MKKGKQKWKRFVQVVLYFLQVGYSAPTQSVIREELHLSLAQVYFSLFT